MLWKTHIRISNEVLRRLGLTLSGEVYSSFTNGLVAPDKWEDFPHHYGKSEKIRENLLKSRANFLNDDLKNAFFYLGVALHYIQDSYTSMASFYLKHKSWEEDIEYAHYTHNLIETINHTLRHSEWQRERCLELANVLSNKTEGRDNTLHIATLSGHSPSKIFAHPTVDFNLGWRASHVVMESVLSSKTCPKLEDKLREVMSVHIVLMRNAEAELANKIIRLTNERNNLIKRKVPPSGTVSKIKNWILAIRSSLKNLAANSNYKSYTEQKHLKKVAKKYSQTADKTVYPYIGWYNYQIPRINPNIIKKELLSVQDIAKVLGENEQALREVFSKVNLSSCLVGNMELVRRPELDRMLSQFPLNGFKDYPAYVLECL